MLLEGQVRICVDVPMCGTNYAKPCSQEGARKTQRTLRLEFRPEAFGQRRVILAGMLLPSGPAGTIVQQSVAGYLWQGA